MSETLIRRAEPHEAKPLAEMIAESFFDLPVCRWLVPDPTERRAVLPLNFEILVASGIQHGTVHTTDTLDAVAIWFANAPEGIPDIPDYDARLEAACGIHTPRFQTLDEVMHSGHPTQRAHEYLAFLAVRPGTQGAGLGSALLKARHEYLDAEDIPAYLEASSPRSRQLYLRNGYVDFSAPLAMPDGPEEAFYPMWRDPQK